MAAAQLDRKRYSCTSAITTTYIHTYRLAPSSSLSSSAFAFDQEPFARRLSKARAWVDSSLV